MDRITQIQKILGDTSIHLSAAQIQKFEDELEQLQKPPIVAYLNPDYDGPTGPRVSNSADHG